MLIKYNGSGRGGPTCRPQGVRRVCQGPRRTETSLAVFGWRSRGSIASPRAPGSRFHMPPRDDGGAPPPPPEPARAAARARPRRFQRGRPCTAARERGRAATRLRHWSGRSGPSQMMPRPYAIATPRLYVCMFGFLHKARERDHERDLTPRVGPLGA